ncbi:related to ferric reductase (metalloreductase) [Cephalotrichum gorgonifer]|uniref:ferric-chelate reductase (NADPH) n=1 Tax=Cephalotrichum gorgonifer TaxID=2041049 RepID=A0AAE8N309_9PEZI|nr:related to ferric reductase (metalloreductase) [Cephalotrichum gorgonifer]
MSHNHGGSSSTTYGTGSFKKKNRELAEAYWYLVAGTIGLVGVTRAIDYLQVVSRRRNCNADYTLSPSRPTGALSQVWATTTALCRELSYPQLHVPLRRLSWASPPPLGRVLILLAYWAVIVYMMAAGAVVDDAYFWERIGFRNAWVTVTQVPLLYMLSMKINPITLVTGLSHERLNWLHRWVARTVFVTATMHGFHFWTQWVRADFVELELRIMPLVKYGLGAWAVLLWNVVTTFYPLRALSYELFVLQHLASAAVFLWLMYRHLPPVAMYNLWLAVGFVAFDRVARWALLAWRNLKLSVGNAPCMGRQRVGHEALVRAEGKSTTVITVRDAHFKWRPGQHLYLWMPTLGPLEAHPYTIACAHKISGQCVCNSVELVVRKHAGFSARLHTAAQKAQAVGGDILRTTAFVSGPYGNPPAWDVYDTVVLISASTGASFTLPILEDIVRAKKKTCLRRVEFVLTARECEETGFYTGRIREALARARERQGEAGSVEFCAHVAITGRGKNSPAGGSIEGQKRSSSSIDERGPGDGTVTLDHLHAESEKASPDDEKAPNSEKVSLDAITPRKPSTSTSASPDVGNDSDIDIMREYDCRLDLSSLIRAPVEAALGETLVVVCGGRSLVANVRNCVAGLSDERGVHKGTGAQGIHLHVEEYSF